MKKLLIMFLLALLVLPAHAAERKLLKDVDTEAFTGDTQITPEGAGDDHLALVWWIPNEFWESVLDRSNTTSQADKQNMLNTMSGVSLIAVVQADISPFGSFNFYSKEEIEKTMSITYTGADGKTVPLSTMQDISSDLNMVLGVFKPILSAAMGNLGNNLHFYVLNDKSVASKRLIDPYEKGVININLKHKNNTAMAGNIEMPLNALFVPRKCPNGKNAHISWNYCPWTGKKLDD